LRIDRSDVWLRTTSFLKKPLGDERVDCALAFALACDGSTMRMESGRAVYEAFRGRTGYETRNEPLDDEPTSMPWYVPSARESMEELESHESRRARPGVGASRCRDDMLNGDWDVRRAMGEELAEPEGESNKIGRRDVHGAEGATSCWLESETWSSWAGVGRPVSGGVYVDFEDEGMLTCSRFGVRGGDSSAAGTGRGTARTDGVTRLRRSARDGDGAATTGEGAGSQKGRRWAIRSRSSTRRL